MEQIIFQNQTDNHGLVFVHEVQIALYYTMHCTATFSNSLGICGLFCVQSKDNSKLLQADLRFDVLFTSKEDL